MSNNLNPDNNAPKGTWGEYAMYVIKAIEAHGDAITELNKEIHAEFKSLHVEIATLKTEINIKSGVFGVLGGLVPILVALIIYLVTRQADALVPPVNQQNNNGKVNDNELYIDDQKRLEEPQFAGNC